jgi:hypothetical protein
MSTDMKIIALVLVVVFGVATAADARSHRHNIRHTTMAHAHRTGR